MKDRDPNRLSFSTNSAEYAASRPTYPHELFTFLSSVCQDCERALDVGTGNGQTAIELAQLYKEVVATDSSAEQLAVAKPHPNIRYVQMDAEFLDFPANYFDLVTVATALHWFDLEKFYARVNHVLRDRGVFAAWGYGFFTIEPRIDAVLEERLLKPLDPYWGAANRLLHEGYKTIPFPYQEIPAPTFAVELDWTLDQLINFVTTWSAVKRYEKERGEEFLPSLRKALEAVWPAGDRKRVTMPLALRVGSYGAAKPPRSF